MTQILSIVISKTKKIWNYFYVVNFNHNIKFSQRRKKLKKTVTLLLLVNAISIFSQELTLDLDNTIQRALEKDKSIKSAELSVDNATLDKKQGLYN